MDGPLSWSIATLFAVVFVILPAVGVYYAIRHARGKPPP